MKSQLITTIAVTLLLGCGESQQSIPQTKNEPAAESNLVKSKANKALLNDANKRNIEEAKQAVTGGDEGLLGHWKFEGDISDSSGNGNNGVAIGGPGFGEGRIGKALKLNGLSQRVELPKLASSINRLTIATWMHVDHMPLNEKFVSIYHNNGWSMGDVHLGYAGQEGVLDLGINGNIPSMCIPTFRVKDIQKRWVHLATTYNATDKKEVRFYLDGQPGEVFKLKEANPVNLGPARIGAWDVEPRWFAGQIDELYIYERVLTEEEIRTIFERRL